MPRKKGDSQRALEQKLRNSALRDEIRQRFGDEAAFNATLNGDIDYNPEVHGPDENTYKQLMPYFIDLSKDEIEDFMETYKYIKGNIPTPLNNDELAELCSELRDAVILETFRKNIERIMELYRVQVELPIKVRQDAYHRGVNPFDKSWNPRPNP